MEYLVDWIDNALQAYIVALWQGKQDDSDYVQSLFNEYYEEDL